MARRPPLSGILAGTLLLASSISWGADPQPAPPAVRVLTVGGASLSLAWDPAWKVVEGAQDFGETVHFETANPLHMHATLNVGPVPPDADPDQWVSAVLDQTAKGLLKQSVEKELTVQPFGQGRT